MAPSIARETKRVWSINVKREEEGRGGFGCLIARGATSTRMDPQRVLGIGHGAIGEPFPRVPASVPWGRGGYYEACGPGWGRDSELHVQINPKQSGLEMPRFGRAADETGQDWTAHRITAHRTPDWTRVWTITWAFWTGQNGSSSAQDTL